MRYPTHALIVFCAILDSTLEVDCVILRTQATGLQIRCTYAPAILEITKRLRYILIFWAFFFGSAFCDGPFGTHSFLNGADRHDELCHEPMVFNEVSTISLYRSCLIIACNL